MNRALKWLKHRRSTPRQSTSLSLRGAFFLFGTTLIGLASFDAGINLLLIVFGVCLGACLASAFSGWHALRRLSVKRMIPDAVTAGRAFEIRYTIRNTARWGVARNVLLTDRVEADGSIAAPQAFVPALRPGEQLILPVPVVARARGRVRLSTIRLASGFPFGIFGKSVFAKQEDELIVLPPLGQLLDEVRPASRAADAVHSGGAPAALRGDDEYYGVREYRLGDNLRRIHWRHTARTGQLMVREMAKTRDEQLWCVVDTRVNPRDAADARRLEAAYCAAATVICDALEKGIKVGLICGGEPLLILPPGGGRAHRPRLLRELALRVRNVDAPLAPHIKRLAWPNRWRGGCLLFAAHESGEVRETAGTLNHAIGPTIVLVPDTSSFDAMFFIPRAASRPPIRNPSEWN
jgi:uncharacterized protein (DUF58 family)